MLTSTVSLNPSANTSYTVYGFDASCSNSAAVTVSVNATPTVNISGNSNMCIGESSTLIASGATSYLWDNSSTSNSISVNPTSGIEYMVVGTNTNGCSSTASHSVIVNPLPNVSILSTNTLICKGENAVLTVTGASTYSWNSGATEALISVTPTTATNYSVTGTDENGCVSSAFFMLGISECTGLTTATNSTNKEFKFYPNPASDKLYLVSNNQSEELQLEIRDLNSMLLLKSILKTTIYRSEIKFDLPNGIYFVSIISKENNRSISKLIISK